MRYGLINDDSGDWFIFPVDQRKEVEDYFRQIEAYFCGDQEFEPEKPKELKEINSPYTLTFENPEDI